MTRRAERTPGDVRAPRRDPSRRPARRIAALGLAALLGLAAAAPATAADPWPTRPVRIVVPFAAGGPADIFARYIGQRLEQQLGQPFVVEDKPGAGSVIGTDLVAKSPADGYTLLLMSNTHTVNESLMPGKPFELMRDFVGIAPLNASDLVLIVHPSLPAQTLPELVALAKSRPGSLNYASSGPGTPYHLAGELFKVLAGVDIVHVPYKGSSAARVDLVGGQVQMMFDAVPTQTAFIREGKVRALATSGLARSAILPSLPTVDEAGVKGYDAVIWLGLMAPRGTPAAIVEKLNDAIGRIVSDPATIAEWRAKGAEPMTMKPAAFADFLAADIRKWERIVKLSGASATR